MLLLFVVVVVAVVVVVVVVVGRGRQVEVNDSWRGMWGRYFDSDVISWMFSEHLFQYIRHICCFERFHPNLTCPAWGSTLMTLEVHCVDLIATGLLRQSHSPPPNSK